MCACMAGSLVTECGSHAVSVVAKVILVDRLVMICIDRVNRMNNDRMACGSV